MDTMISIEGEILASQAPRMNRNTIRPGKDVKAAEIMQEAPQPKKQIRIHQLTGRRTKAHTDTTIRLGRG